MGFSREELAEKTGYSTNGIRYVMESFIEVGIIECELMRKVSTGQKVWIYILKENK